MSRRLVWAVGLAALGIIAGAAAPQAQVVAVTPSGPTVPEKLLRISATFAVPQQEGLTAPVALLRDDGGAIPGALLDQPVWSPDRRTVVLLLDPGRVKTGLIVHGQAGPVLRAGERVALRMAGEIVHRWTVVAGGCAVPDLAAWAIEAPKADTREPLSLGFPAPIDAMSRDLVAVADAAGNRVDGAAHLIEGERRWRFAPAANWRRGTLYIIVHPRLESPCGDEPGEPFEHRSAQVVGSSLAVLRRSFLVE